MKFFASALLLLLLGRTKATGPDFDDIACDVVDCLDPVLEKFDDDSLDGGSSTFTTLVEKSESKLTIAQGKMYRTGQVIVSQDRIRQGVLFADRAKVEAPPDDNDAIPGSDARVKMNEVAKRGSKCSVDFAEALFDAAELSLGAAARDVASAAIDKANAKRDAKKWYQATVETLKATRAIMNDLGRREIEPC